MGHHPKGKARTPLADVRGGVQLAVEGTRHITGLVEALHGQILRLAPPLRARSVVGPSEPIELVIPTRGITGLVYRSIQGGTKLVGDGLQGLLGPLDKVLGQGAMAALPAPKRDAVVAALNGVLGDHLVRSGNPLAIALQLRQGGQALDPATLGLAAPDKVLLMVHGLCMSDTGWRRFGHDHGALLGPAIQAAPVYAFYNSGLHISINGRDLAEAIEHLVQRWPVPLKSLVIVGHSMGGLVARSACAQAAASGHQWLGLLKQMVFLGTPHHGAPLERAGNWLHRVMDLSPYVAPFTRLSSLRSQGITDLRHGNLLASDWQEGGRFDHRGRRTPVPLPQGVDCYALASTVGGVQKPGSMLGDGLVPVESALGHHKRPEFDLGLPADHCWVGHGIGHLDLLSDPLVYRRLLHCLG
jgi:pimeloyl-ACP methyl ester carboxylesterase